MPLSGHRVKAPTRRYVSGISKNWRNGDAARAATSDEVKDLKPKAPELRSRCRAGIGTALAQKGLIADGGDEAWGSRLRERVWNRIPDDIRDRIVAMALEVPELSP